MTRVVGALLALLLMAGGALADPVSVVKVLNFGCPACRASEALDAEIARATRMQGGRFVYAPIPSDPNAMHRELAYYAAREMGMEQVARESLYKGSQDYGLAFSEPGQVVVWLQDDAGIDASRLSAGMSGEAARKALGRALRLVGLGGVQRLPTYLVLRDGRVAAAHSAEKGSLFSLRAAVIESINKLNTEAETTK